MSNADIIVRGATVVWTVNFTDINGDPTNPDAANLYLNFKRGRRDQDATIVLDQNGFDWTGEWESAIADAGQVEWHVRSDGTFIAALQGSFRLDINRANPAA